MRKLAAGIVSVLLAASLMVPMASGTAEDPIVLTDDFQVQSPLWTFLGCAAIVPDGNQNQVLQLTPAEESKTGTVWLNQPISPPFAVEFKYRMREPRDSYIHYGADGIVLMFNKQRNLEPVDGGGMGFETDEANPDNGNGYGIEFDTFHNEEWEDSGSHITLFHKTPSSLESRHRLAVSEQQGVWSETWKQVRVEVGADDVRVYWGDSLDATSEPVLEWEASGDNQLDMTYQGLGLSASTGWGYSAHEVDDFRLTIYEQPGEQWPVEQPGEEQMCGEEPGEEPGDMEPPVITLNGPSTVIVEKGGQFGDLGALVLDDMDGEQYIIGEGEVNTQVAGTYTITYTASDLAGNEAAAVTRTVVVVDRSELISAIHSGEGGVQLRHIAAYLSGGGDLDEDGIVGPHEVRYLLSLLGASE